MAKKDPTDLSVEDKLKNPLPATDRPVVNR